MTAKKIILICSLLTMNLLSVAQDQLPVTVFFYDVAISQDFQAALTDLDETVEGLSELLKGKDILKEGIIDETYHKLAAQLKDSTKFELLPISTLQTTDGKKILYTARGYPMGNKKRAVTHHTSKYYSSIYISVFARSGVTSITDVGRFESERMKVRPSVRVDMDIFDDQGGRIGKYRVKANTKEEVVIQTKMILDWFKVGDDRRFADENNQQVLEKLIDEAITMLIEEIADQDNMVKL